LREACQTDMDGTSIDTLETVGRQLGLDLAQILIPTDLLFLETSSCLLPSSLSACQTARRIL